MQLYQKAIAALAATAAAGGLISYYEGTVHKGYVDPVGVVTACTGHTKTAKLGRVYTQAECATMLDADMAEAAAAVRRNLARPVPQETFDALVSFTFNVGEGNLQRSTLLSKINAGDIAGGCAELTRWVYAKGVKLPGLVKRRVAEQQLCREGLT